MLCGIPFRLNPALRPFFPDRTIRQATALHGMEVGLRAGHRAVLGRKCAARGSTSF